LQILRVTISDARSILKLQFGELARSVEPYLACRRDLIGKASLDDLFLGRVLINAAVDDKQKVVDALELLLSECPVMGLWLRNDISVIKTARWSSAKASFHYPGPLIGITGTELDYDCINLAGLLARRIALTRLMRHRAPFSAFGVMRAHVMALGWEARFLRNIEGAESQLQTALERQEYWLAMLGRWPRVGPNKKKKAGLAGH
jgi:hypothetical protein